MPRLLLALSALLLASCASSPPLDYWFVDSLTKVFPDSPRFHERLNVAEFQAARRSSLSIQLAVCPHQHLGLFSVDAPPLSGPGLPLESITVRWVDFVVVTSNTPNTPNEELLARAPALFPDPLMEQFPIGLEKNKSRSLWITVRIPADQEPGAYRGELRLRLARDVIARVPYTVNVTSATVPDPIPLAVSNHFNLSDNHLRQFYGVTRFSDDWWTLLANIARFLAAHHQTSVVVDPVRFVTVTPAGGALRYDFSQFARFVETFTEAGVRGSIEGGNLLTRERRPGAPVMVRAWVLENGQPVLRDLPWEDWQAQRFLSGFLPELNRFLQSRGWSKRYLQGILDEPRPNEVPPYVATAALIRRFLPGVRTIEPVGARQDLSFLESTTDIWVPQLGTFDDKLDALRAHAARGGEVWLYTALAPRGPYPNRFLDYSLLKTRIIHWMNYKYDFRGFLHWGGNFWGPEPFKDTQPVINRGRTYLPPGDAFITYPNRPRLSLLSSIRFEQMREGIEDFGLLTALAASNPARARELADLAVRSFSDYVRRPAEFRQIHRLLLEAR